MQNSAKFWECILSAITATSRSPRRWRRWRPKQRWIRCATQSMGIRLCTKLSGKPSKRCMDSPSMRNCVVSDLGRIGFLEAYAIQQKLVSERKEGRIGDQLLFLEHPHVITMGRNGHLENMLAGEDFLASQGVEFHHTDRGGDVTYHGPGQVVAYPIFDLREWKRDVGAYVRGLEQVVMDTLDDYGIQAERVPGCTGVWVGGKKVCPIGVHLSRWVT